MILARLVDRQGVLLDDKNIVVADNTDAIVARDTNVNQHDRIFIYNGADQSRLIAIYHLPQASCLIFVECNEWYVHDEQHPGPRP